MRFRKRNYHAFLWHAGFLALTSAFTDMNTVLPSLVVKAGGGTVLIGLLTAIMVGTPILGQLLLASYLHMKRRKKGFLLLGIKLRVVALAAVSLILYRSASLPAATLITLVFLLMFLFSSAGTFAAVSYTDILGKSLQPQRRGSFFVNRQIITSLAILASAPISRWILKTHEYPYNYIWLFGLASLLLLVASGGFWYLREPVIEPADDAQSFMAVLRAIPRQLRECPQLRHHIFLVNLTGFGLTLMPFYVAYASQHHGLTGEQVGSYLMVQIV
ncbi:MAG: MFS transporter, partial [Deltaproteobacteria bacterium]